MPFTLPDLPFAKDALAPHMSAETFDYHHGKHHNAYVTKANAMTEGTPLHDMALEDAVVEAHKQGGGVFNNIAQHYNHSFFWTCLTPNGGGAPTGDLASQIESDLGGLDAFKDAFKTAGGTQFGSGWVWLCLDSAGKLQIVKTANADCPLTDGLTPILTCDVWEHAYYLDYQNRRPDFLTTYLESLVNWDFAASNYDAAKSKLQNAA